jgi:hypothetical protein
MYYFHNYRDNPSEENKSEVFKELKGTFTEEEINVFLAYLRAERAYLDLENKLGDILHPLGKEQMGKIKLFPDSVSRSLKVSRVHEDHVSEILGGEKG